MAAVLSPPQLLPDLRSLRPVRRAGTAGRSFTPATPWTSGAPADLVRARQERPVARTKPSHATYVRRRAVALLVLAVVGVASQLALLMVAQRAAATITAPAASAAVTESTTRVAGDGPTAADSMPAVAPLPTVYVVQPGDTLWSIARTIQPVGDIRPLVDELAERAGPGVLKAGQKLDLDGLGG